MDEAVRKVVNGLASAPEIVIHAPRAASALRVDGVPAGGAEVQMVMLAKELVRLGRRVGIVVRAEGKLPDNVDGVAVFRQQHPDGQRRLFGRVHIQEAIFESLKPARGGIVIHRGGGPDALQVAVAARRLRATFVLSAASISDFNWRTLTHRRPDIASARWAVRMANRVVTQTPDQQKAALAAGCENAVMIPSIVPMPDLAAARRPTPVAFLWAGRLVDYKQPDAYLRLAQMIPDRRFRIVGVDAPAAAPGGGIGETVKEMARKIPNVELLGEMSRGSVGCLIEESFAVVNTSYSEGMPNVLLEAWARGVPTLVLHYDPGGLITQHDLGGFARGSEESLRSLAEGLADDPAHRYESGARCRRYVELFHAPKEVAGRWIDALESAGLPDRGHAGTR